MKAPHARYRLYTSWQNYLPFLRDLFLFAEPGDFIDGFRRRLGAFLNADRVTTLPMCRTGIHLAIKHLIQPGQEVVMSPYTIGDVVNMVVAAGGRPVFADIERSTCGVSVREIEALIHAGTGAVLVTHLHGIAAPIREVCELCAEKGIPVIEDAAQAFGARLAGEPLGTVADVGVYSFGTYKNITSWYGGAITCKDPELFAAIEREVDRLALQSTAFLVKRMLHGLLTDMATHPVVFRSVSYWIFRFGLLHDIKWINRFVEEELDLSLRDSVPETHLGQMTPAQHRLCSAQLDHVERDNQIRVEKAARYREGLEGIAGIVLPPVDSGDAIYTYFPIQCGDGDPERRRLLRHLSRHGCDVGPQHLKNCADLPAFRDFQRDCPNARKAAGSVVLLPTYPDYPDDDVAHNLAVLRDFASSRSS
jgi:dTDP-4-amino-4,6-dideoxygalactose transaminase